MRRRIYLLVIFLTVQHAQALKCDWPPIEHALTQFRPNSLLDLGCGLGAYLNLSEKSGIDVIGVDGSCWSNFHLIRESKYIQHDLSKGPPEIRDNFDVSMCLEVLEHLPEEAGLSIVEFLSKHSRKGIIFSAARPNQPGHCHITCREPDFWLGLFKENGWSVDPAVTISLRLTSTFHWFKRNIFVLRPAKQTDENGLWHIMSLVDSASPWPSQGGEQKLIGFAGQQPSYTLDGESLIPPMPSYVDNNKNSEEMDMPIPAAIEEKEQLPETSSFGDKIVNYLKKKLLLR